jgi:aminopeptidase N
MMLPMPGTNLTRDEAAERARLLSVDSYTVDLDLTRSETTFDSTTVLRFSCTQPGASTFADLVDASIKQLSLNGRDLDLSAYSDSRIRLDDLAADNVLRVVAECPYSRTGEGMHRFVDPADDRIYLYTQFEVPDARRVFTTFEQPDLKATFQFTVTAPSDWQVVSNSPTPKPEPVGDGVSVWRFAPTLRMSTYITAVVAGEYAVVRDSYTGAGGEIPLGLFCRQSLLEHLDADDILEITRQGFEFFESTFDYPYPFGKYDQLFVPEYNMGAMENAGCVTFRDEYIYRSRQTVAAYESRANTILHEMAHMWFGDLVTMRWWDDLWLNESFAEWASHHSMVHATRFTEGWTGFSNARKGWAYRQDQLPSTHPIAADNADLEAVEVNFDGITYAKGASSLRQLVAWVGEEHFVSGLRAYFRDHAFGNTDLDHLMDALEAASGRDLESWTQEWLQTSGVNTLRPRFETDDDGAFTSFVVEQSAHPDFPTLRRHRIAVGLYDREGSRLVLRDSIEVDISGAKTDLPELVGLKRPDLVLLNDQDLSYAKIRLDAESLKTLTEHIHQIDDSLARALCWGAAWDMTRDAEMRASDFLTLVLAGVGTETDMTAVASLLRQATTAVHLFAAPENQATLAARWEAGLRSLLHVAASGSDHQLALARAYARAATSEQALDLIEGLLTGEASLHGLQVDADLRWTLVSALARTGRYGEADIAAELERDNTISGQENAAAARAMRPDAEAKRRAWEDAVVRDDVANETQRSIAAAFQVHGQEELLLPYVDTYLDVARRAWEDKGVQRATIILLYLFPRALTRPDVLEKVDAWLADESVPAAARRLVGEGRSDLVRALTAQSFDASA